MAERAESIQIVDLQTDRTCACAFETVENSHYVCVRKRAGRFDENGFFDSHAVRQIGAIAQFIAIDVVLKPLLKQIRKRSANLARVVD